MMGDGVWIPACAGMTEERSKIKHQNAKREEKDPGPCLGGDGGTRTPRINLGAKYKIATSLRFSQ